MRGVCVGTWHPPVPGLVDSAIYFNQSDHSNYVPQPVKATLVLDPIIGGCHLSKVLLDGSSSINMLYLKTMEKMGIPPSCLRLTSPTFQGIVLVKEAQPMG